MTPMWSRLGLLTVAAVLFFLRFGYDFGAGDQDDLFSLLLHQLDPSVFANDWYVVDQGGQFTVRTPFLWLMGGLMTVLPLWAAALLLYVASWTGVAWGIARLAESLGAAPVAVWGATLTVLVGVLTWTLGGNALVGDLLAPEMVAWALALSAVRLAHERRLIHAGVLLGLAAYLHLLVGALVTGALGLAILLGALGAGEPGVRQWSQRVRQAVHLGGTTFLVALPMIVMIVRYRLASSTPPAGDLSPFYLFAELRLPHHYLPSAFSPGRWARFAVLAIGGVLGLASRRQSGTPIVFAERLLLAIGLWCLIAAPLIELVEILFVAQLQVFKLTVLANAILVIGLWIGLLHFLPDRIRSWHGLSPQSSVAVASLCVLLGGIGLASGVLDDRVGPWRRADLPVTSAEDWLRDNLPSDAVVAAPPNSTTFRLRARRATVGTFKATPFQNGAIHEWHRRLLALAPRADTSSSRGLAFGDALDEAYAQNTEADWSRLARTYGITHVLRERSSGDPPPGRRLFRAGDWEVYDVALPTGRGEGEEIDPAAVR